MTWRLKSSIFASDNYQGVGGRQKEYHNQQLAVTVGLLYTATVNYNYTVTSSEDAEGNEAALYREERWMTDDG